MKTIEKSLTVLLPDVIFKLLMKFENSMISAWVGAAQNGPGDKFFIPGIFEVLRTSQK